MEEINELELRNVLKGNTSPEHLTTEIIKRLVSDSQSWEEKRPFWQFLLAYGRHSTLAYAMAQCLRAKARIPFDVFIKLCSTYEMRPPAIVLEALLKGLRKQDALDELLASRGFDEHDKRLAQMRKEVQRRKVEEKRQFKTNLREKFEFLLNQNMMEQARRVLRRMVDLYPEETEFIQLKQNFEEQWAREVLSNHVSRSNLEKIDRTLTEHSTEDKNMLAVFLNEAQKLVLEKREIAIDAAMAFLFLEDHFSALEMLAWAQPSKATDWMKAELLFSSRHFVELLEWLNYLEIKYVDDPETTFSVSYLRAQCLYGLGQQTTALETMQSIVRIRPSYRSAHALILSWTEGVDWE